MSTRSAFFGAAFLVASQAIPALAADDALQSLFQPIPTPLHRDLKPINERILAKLDAGLHGGSVFTNELNAVAEILKRHPSERPEKIAEVRYNLARGYWKLCDDPKRAIQLLEELRRDFPQTSYAPKATQDIEDIPKIDAGIALRKTIEVAKAFPDFEVRDLSGRTLSVAGCRGRPVLILSWSIATAPLLQFEKLLAWQKQSGPDTFEVIGLNLDEDEGRVRDYLKTNNIPWRQYFDGRGRRNELALRYQVGPAHYAFVLDREGCVVAMDPMTWDDLQKAMSKALRK